MRRTLKLLNRRAAMCFVVLCSLSCAGGANAADIIDYLNVPGPLQFNGRQYRLVWSSHPSKPYFKQEYVPNAQTFERFTEMVLIEAVIQGTDVKKAVAAQLNKLNERKEIDPMVNFAMVSNPKDGNVILDFLVGDDGSGQGQMVEWNAYRYAPFKDKSGNSGVVLLGVVRRAYADEIEKFLRILKSQRSAEINALASYQMPVLQPKP